MLADANSPSSTTFIEGRIVGGRPARANQFPYQALIRHRNGDVFCGGAIIGNRFILTSANCFQRYRHPSDIRAVVGAHRRADDGFAHVVVRIARHPQFDPNTIANDIAMLLTQIPIRINHINVAPIELRQLVEI